MVYEGANEIQAVDLLQRKVAGDGGAALREWLHEALEEAARCDGAAPGQGSPPRCARSARRRRPPPQPLRRPPRPTARPRCARPTTSSWAWRMPCSPWAFAASARAAADHPARDWAQAKVARMRYGLQWVLPQAQVHWAGRRPVAGAAGAGGLSARRMARAAGRAARRRPGSTARRPRPASVRA
jgi:hypothetical protein